MATAGSLDFVLTANSTQLRQELGKVRQEAQATGLSISSLFGSDTLNAASFKLLRGTVLGLVNDIDEINNGLSLTDSLTRNVAASFSELSDIALLELGQIAQFLGDDLFETPLAGLQSGALERTGLGQLEGAFKIVSAGANASKILETALGGLTTGFNALDGVLGEFQGKAQTVSDFFQSIGQNAQLLSSILVSAADLIDGAIDSVLDTLASINPAFAMVREGAKALGFEFSVGKSLLGDYIDNLNQIDEASRTAANASQQVADATGEVRGGLTSASSTAADFEQRLESQRKAAEGFESAMKDLADAATLFDAYQQVSAAFDQLFGSLEQNFNAAKAAESLNNRLQLVSTSAGGASEDLAFLNKVTDDLGIDFDAAAAGFTSFSTATNLAGLSAEQTKDTFTGVAQAASVMGLSAGDTQGVLLALQKALSGGNLSLEELNQLAERIPGTFQAAAAALGVTTDQVKGLISSGTVDSAEFLPKFSEQLKNFTESGLVDAMNSGEAAVNRFNNALGNFQIAAGQAWLEVGTPALNTFAKAINFAAENEELFSTAIDALLVASLPLFISGILKATAAAGQFITTNKALTVNAFGQQLSVTAAQLGKFAAQAGLAYAATILFYRVMDRAKDSAEGTRSAISSLDKSITELKGSSEGAGETLANVLPKEPPPLDWLDTMVDGLNKADAALNRFLGLDEDFLKLTTNAEKALNDQLIAIGDFSEKAQAILGESLNFRQVAENGGGALAVLKETEAALKRIEQARLAADPKDQEGLAKIAAEEAEILKRRADAAEEVRLKQSALNNALTQARQELQNLDPSKLGTEGFEKAKQQLEAQINLLEKEKVKFDELTKASEATAESITQNFEKSSKALDKSFSESQIAIEEALAAGTISQEKAQQQQLEAERKFLEDRLKLNREAAQKLKTELENNAKLKAIDPAKATLSTEKEKEYQQQLEQIELDIAKNRIDLAKSVQGEKQRLNEQELANIREAQTEAEAIAQRTENSRIAAIKQRQASGQVSEAEAAREIEAIQQNSILSQIAAEKEKLEQVESLKQRGVLTTEQAAEQEREILGKLSDLNLQRIDAELQARKEANAQAVQDLEDGIKKAEAAIDQSQNSRKQGVGKAQLGGLSQEDAARATAKIEQDLINETLALRQKELQQVEELRARGVISAKEAADREAGIVAEIGDLKLQQINAEIKAQQDLIDAASQSAQDRAQITAHAEAERIARIKEAQAAGVLGEQEAARQIAGIQANSVAENLRIKQEELAQLQALRSSGQLSIEEAADRERSLIGEISGLRQQAAEADLAVQEQVKQTRLTAIEEIAEAERVAEEVRQGRRELESQALENQNNLLSAQSALLQAQSSLTQQRLQNAIEEAEANGQANRAQELKKRLIAEQIRAQEQQAQIEIAQLRLKQQQNALDMQNAKIQAEIALRESEIELTKARINGASAQEIANLQAILGLRGQQLAALSEQAAAQQQINQMEAQALALKQQQTREALKQQNVQASKVATDTGSSAHLPPAGQRSSNLNGGGSSFNGFGQPPDIMSITDKLTDLGNAGDLSTVFQTANLGLKLKLGGLSPGGLGSSAPAFGGADQGAILGKLDQMIAATKASGGRPNLSISNVNDLGLAGQIYSDISRDSFRSAGL